MELKLELICMLFALMMCSTINFSPVLGPLGGRLDVLRLDTSTPKRKLGVGSLRGSMGSGPPTVGSQGSRTEHT
jgi:hypothetical protein